MMEKKFRRILVRVLQGDITESKADAIVNAANNQLWMGAGVAGAIKRKGGEEIEKEAVAKGPIDVGDAVATGAGKLAASYVVHAAAMGQDLVTDEAKIYSATRASLERAEELKLSSIAFPALGTGVGGFPASDAARIMLRAVVEHGAGDGSIDEVRFCLFDEATLGAFEKALGETE